MNATATAYDLCNLLLFIYLTFSAAPTAAM
jgi:hypothetical protein